MATSSVPGSGRQRQRTSKVKLYITKERFSPVFSCSQRGYFQNYFLVMYHLLPETSLARVFEEDNGASSC